MANISDNIKRRLAELPEGSVVRRLLGLMRCWGILGPPTSASRHYQRPPPAAGLEPLAPDPVYSRPPGARGSILRHTHPLALLRAAVATQSPFLPALPLRLHHLSLPSKRGSGPGFTCTTLVAEAILLPIVTPEQGQLPGRRRAAEVSGVGSVGRSLCDVTEEL